MLQQGHLEQTLQHAATTAAHCNAMQHTTAHYSTPQHTTTYCTTLQHTAPGELHKEAPHGPHAATYDIKSTNEKHNTAPHRPHTPARHRTIYIHTDTQMHEGPQKYTFAHKNTPTREHEGSTFQIRGQSTREHQHRARACRRGTARTRRRSARRR